MTVRVSRRERLRYELLGSNQEGIKDKQQREPPAPPSLLSNFYRLLSQPLSCNHFSVTMLWALIEKAGTVFSCYPILSILAQSL